jgi:hypothetical protein
MEAITSEAELAERHAEGDGCIYNDFGSEQQWNVEAHNKLHLASCRHVRKYSEAAPKLWAPNLEDAVQWLEENRGEDGWTPCKDCLGDETRESLVSHHIVRQ